MDIKPVQRAGLEGSPPHYGMKATRDPNYNLHRRRTAQSAAAGTCSLGNRIPPRHPPSSAPTSHLAGSIRRDGKRHTVLRSGQGSTSLRCNPGAWRRLHGASIPGTSAKGRHTLGPRTTWLRPASVVSSGVHICVRGHGRSHVQCRHREPRSGEVAGLVRRRCRCRCRPGRPARCAGRRRCVVRQPSSNIPWRFRDGGAPPAHLAAFAFPLRTGRRHPRLHCGFGAAASKRSYSSHTACGSAPMSAIMWSLQPTCTLLRSSL